MNILTIDLELEENPLIVADDIGIFISRALREERISLYSAFLLNQDVLRLRRLGYRQPAWRYQLSLSGVLSLYMQYLFALAVDEVGTAKKVATWLQEDVPLLVEQRDHYLRNHFMHSLGVKPSEAQLNELSEIRSRCATLADDDGPFHTEVFPYDYYSPEDALLGRLTTFAKPNTIEPDVEDLLLSISVWG